MQVSGAPTSISLVQLLYRVSFLAMHPAPLQESQECHPSLSLCSIYLVGHFQRGFAFGAVPGET